MKIDLKNLKEIKLNIKAEIPRGDLAVHSEKYHLLKMNEMFNDVEKRLNRKLKQDEVLLYSMIFNSGYAAAIEGRYKKGADYELQKQD